MTTSRVAARAVLLLVLMTLAVVRPAVAQNPLDAFRLTGEIVAGVRFYLLEPSDRNKGKLEEYRDLSSGALVEGVYLRLARPDESYATEFGGDKWGREDQHYFLNAERLGLWSFGFDWDQIPHVDSTTARLRHTENDRGRFTLPTPRPNLNTYNTATELDEISKRWDTMRVFLTLSPTPDVDLKAEYTRIRKEGDRPFSIAFSSPGGNFLEILSPISQTIHDVRLRGTMSGESWQLQAGYGLSIFNNGVRAVVADNPCFGLAAAVAAGGCAGDATGAQATGRMSVEPDNIAHTFSIAGAVNLPMRTRLSANASYSLRMQDESFLAHTINPAIASTTLALPAQSLDGNVGITLINLNLTTRPLNPLTITARYRFYDHDDMTGEVVFPGHVVNDRTLVIEDRTNPRFGYTRHNADLDARWRFGRPVAVTIGGGWERWDRVNHREVQLTDEVFAKAALDVTPVDWLLARLTYRPSFRRLDEYLTFAHLEHTVLEEETPDQLAQGQSVLLRKFDEANRDRHAVDLTLQFSPFETLTATLIGEYRSDDYYDSPLGLQHAYRWGVGMDVSWQPSEHVSVFGGYMHEVIHQKQRSRSRPVTGTTTFDFTDFDWLTFNVDTVDTLHLGAEVAVIPNTLILRGAASFSYALGEVDNRNPLGPPRSGSAAQNATAVAHRWPAFEDTLVRLDLAARYHFAKVWTLTVAYAWESFKQSDWRTEGLTPFLPGVTSSIFLGNDSRNYNAHIAAITLGYRFK
jgi:MtrB/PioB family decaheme-associated outer membrane protein